MRAHRSRSIHATLILLAGVCQEQATAQCSGIVSNPAEASACVSFAIPDPKVAAIDRQHQYSLVELIDIGERNHPSTRTTWERAKQQAKRLGIEKSEYFPVLAASVLFADQRVVQPFPKPLSPTGYSIADLPLVEPQLELRYLLLDSGGRKIIAQQCAYLARELRSNPEIPSKGGGAVPQTNLEQVESTLSSLGSITTDTGKSATLQALPSKHVPLLIPGAGSNMTNVAFALKISLCAPLCYIIAADESSSEYEKLTISRFNELQALSASVDS